MALIDRAIVGADSLVLHSSALIDHVSGAAVTSTGAQIDPIVSGSNFAHAFDGTASSKTITINHKSLALYNEICIETSVHVSGAFTQYSIMRSGTDELLWFVTSGLIRVTIPYSTPVVMFIPFTPDDTLNVSISATRNNYAVWFNGVQVASGSVSEMQFKPNTTITMTSPSPSAGTLVFGHFALYPEVQPADRIHARLVETVGQDANAQSQYDFEVFEFSDFSQDFVVKYDFPKSVPWEDVSLPGTKVVDGVLQLDLSVVEEYDSAKNAYVVSSPNRMFGEGQGLVHVYIPSFVASGAVRGIVELASVGVGKNEYGLRFTAADRVEVTNRVFSVDSNGVENSTTTTTTLNPPATGIPNATVVSVGFGWDSTGLYAVYGSTATLIDAGFQPGDYEVVFGNTRDVSTGLYAYPYFANQAAWTWHLRLWNAFNPASPTVSSTSYGNHTFFSAEINTAPIPVRAEVNLKIAVPLPEGVALRLPYLYLDGEMTGTITEAVE
jgi:hypothetical protein